MGVNYYSCDCCGDARYGDYVSECDNCGAMICNNCIDNDKDEDWFDIINNNGGMIPKDKCPFCSGIEIDKEDLLKFILEKYKINYDEVVKEYRNEVINN